MSEPTINYIPNEECVRNAIWNAIKTKTNFMSSEHLHNETTQGNSNTDTYGPWTEGIWFKDNISIGDSTYDTTKDSTTRTQFSLNGLFTDEIPVINIETGDKGITKEWIDEHFNAKTKNIRISDKFIYSQDAETFTPINVIESKAIEAKTLLIYLQKLQNQTTNDSRVDQIIKDVYANTNEEISEISDTIPENSILKYGEILKKIIYEGSNGGTPSNPAIDSLLYIVKGEKPTVKPYGGLVDDIFTIKTDLYGTSGTSLNLVDNSIKQVYKKTVQQNGVLMEQTDYIYLGKNAEPTINQTIPSQVFNSDGLILEYVIKSESTSSSHGTFYGLLNGEYHNMTSSSEYDEPYPCIKTLKIQYVDNQKNLINLIYDITTRD